MTDDLRSAPVTGGGLIAVCMVVAFVVVLMGANWLVETLAHWGVVMPHLYAPTPEIQAAWDKRMKELNRLPAMGPNGPVDVAGLWADPSRETQKEFLERARLAYKAAKERL